MWGSCRSKEGRKTASNSNPDPSIYSVCQPISDGQPVLTLTKMLFLGKWYNDTEIIWHRVKREMFKKFAIFRWILRTLDPNYPIPIA